MNDRKVIQKDLLYFLLTDISVLSKIFLFIQHIKYFSVFENRLKIKKILVDITTFDVTYSSFNKAGIMRIIIKNEFLNFKARFHWDSQILKRVDSESTQNSCIPSECFHYIFEEAWVTVSRKFSCK